VYKPLGQMVKSGGVSEIEGSVVHHLMGSTVWGEILPRFVGKTEFGQRQTPERHKWV